MAVAIVSSEVPSLLHIQW